MHHIAIKPVWTIQDHRGQALSPHLIEVLTHVSATGSLQAACKVLGKSYRHGWALIRDAEALFGMPLLTMTRGKGSALTPLGAKLVWADERIAARLAPVLDSLASELRADIGAVLPNGVTQPPMRLHASHGYAIEQLVTALQARGQPVQRRYVRSVAAAAALQEGACDVCGFHIPMGTLQSRALSHHLPWLTGGDWQVIDLATRRQGLMVAPGNPCKVYALTDLTRQGVRFMNRPPGSGTRWLLENLLQAQAVAEDQVNGFERYEDTHAAVAAAVASELATVGFGLEAAARQYRLDFLPLAMERYFLVCHTKALDSPALATVLAVLRSPAFQATVNALPGYEAHHIGRIRPWQQAFD